MVTFKSLLVITRHQCCNFVFKHKQNKVNNKQGTRRKNPLQKDISKIKFLH